MTDAKPDTIFALSSGRPPAAIAVIRISGPRAGEALTALGVKVPEPRRAALARVRDPGSNEIIDEGLALFFPGPRSETGEDVVELQLHGGRAVIAGVLEALGRLEGLRPAEAGEFTRRAFENGKLDLTAVEGLADLVAAETEGQRRLAFRQMKGALGGRADEWRRKLIQALALIEARIDFSDEADVPEDLVGPALAMARELAAGIEAALADGRRGERLREGLVVAIAGPPNAGKSTLLNRIAQREAAIVSPYAGTTRDVIEVHLDLDGWPVTLLDTAGIRDSGDPVEMEGVRRARARAAAADLVLWVVDVSADAAGSGGLAGDPDVFGLRTADEGVGGAGAPAIWLVRNKIDLVRACGARSELPERIGSSNESDSQVTGRNESGSQANASLRNMVKEVLTPKTEALFSRSESEIRDFGELGCGVWRTFTGADAPRGGISGRCRVGPGNARAPSPGLAGRAVGVETGAGARAGGSRGPAGRGTAARRPCAGPADRAGGCGGYPRRYLPGLLHRQMNGVNPESSPWSGRAGGAALPRAGISFT